ncbi:UvrD-helicase domain-containing protein [Thermoflavimicrobium daqui]|uniref:DNA 3'-5' helicase n=1 Tax=Thermoflavimicrobium daqui TaxID=2137476 RepID=A0A364K148_9BACL|nr:UvrD-helicase domain-containing protein [Thermoflavimicrobium daqui]RAL21420.1 hypothetical protein DL897_16365 [Thermoflavimicrobium daqui]
MKINPNYSVIIYTTEINKKMIEQIEQWIQSGIKVLLFTTDILEEYEEKTLWQKWRKQQFYYWFEIPFRAEYDNRTVYFIDGQITDLGLFEYLCKHSQQQGFYSFNSEQYRVEHAPPHHHLFVMAGSGTGKTTVMINRLLYLKHLNPTFLFSQVAMITFTNEAATVIRQKLHRRIRDYYELTMNRKYLDWIDELRNVEISTIHTFAKKLFERDGREIGFSKKIQIRGYQEERRFQIERMIDQFAHDHPEIYQQFETNRYYHLVQSIQSVIEQLDHQSLHETDIESIDFGYDDKGFGQLLKYVIVNGMRELQLIKEENDQWEVHDLIRKLHDLQQVEGFKPQVKLQYIMVDEFQDTDAVQVQFLLWLQKVIPYCRLFVVGDVKQSIYRFRGADYTAFTQLRKGLPDQPLTQIHLNKNYRSQSTLLEEMDSLFKNWGAKIEGFPYQSKDKLQAMNREGEGGIYEQDFSLNVVWKKVLSELEGKETAILVRSNALVQETIAKCEQMGFFCEGNTSGSFYRSLPVRELYLVIRFLLLPQSSSSLYALHRSSYGDDTLSHQELIHHFTPDRDYALSLLQKQPDYDYWQQILRMAKYTPPVILLEEIIKTRQPHQRYGERLWLRISRKRSEVDPPLLKKQCLYLLDQYQTRLSYLLYLLKKHFSDSIATLHGLERFLRIHMQTDTEEKDPKVPERVGNQTHIFRCMTVHQAKGQEFDHVVLPRTDSAFIVPEHPHIFVDLKGSTPSVAYQLKLDDQLLWNSIYSQLKQKERDELIAEETRLLYVAMTRARKSLFIQTPAIFKQKRPNSWADLLSWKGEKVIV